MRHTVFMKTVLQKVNRFFEKVRGLFPSPLPQGRPQFESWVDSIRSLYKLPTKDRDSVLFTISTALIHLGPITAYKSKYYFVLMIRASAAKQIAGACFYDVKTRQQAAAKTPEVTAKEQALTSAQNPAQI